MRCEAITRAGSRCRLNATPGAAWCYSHDPARVEERRRNARKAGRSGGNGRAAGGSELGQLKRQIRDLIAEIRAGELERGPAAVMLQAYNVLARYLELERRRDEDALEERLEALEQSVMELAEAGARWGA
jgi:hypothetical protein